MITLKTLSQVLFKAENFSIMNNKILSVELFQKIQGVPKKVTPAHRFGSPMPYLFTDQVNILEPGRYDN